MHDPSVDDMRARDMARKRLNTTLHFWNHAALDRTVNDQLATMINRQLTDQLILRVEYAFHIRQQHQFFRPGAPPRSRRPPRRH